MNSEEMDEMIAVMRAEYPKCKDPDLRHAMKSLAQYLKSQRHAPEALDENTVAYLRKRYNAILS